MVASKGAASVALPTAAWALALLAGSTLFVSSRLHEPPSLQYEGCGWHVQPDDYAFMHARPCSLATAD